MVPLARPTTDPRSLATAVLVVFLTALAADSACAMAVQRAAMPTHELHDTRALTKASAMDDLRGINSFNITAPAFIGYVATDLPSVCANANTEQNDKMYAYDLYFSDCGSAFTACLAEDSGMSLDAVMVDLGRTPVGFRRFVDTLIVTKNNGTTQPLYESDWYANGADIVCAGSCEQTTFWHLAASSAYQQLGDSARQSWQEAVDSDSCVATDIAAQSYEQAFAEASVVNIYHKAYGDYPPRGDCSCMQSQFGFLNSLPLFGASLLGNTCAINDGLGGVSTKAPANLTDSTVLVDKSSSDSVSAGAAPTISGYSLSAPPDASGTTVADTTPSQTSSATFTSSPSMNSATSGHAHSSNMPVSDMKPIVQDFKIVDSAASRSFIPHNNSMAALAATWAILLSLLVFLECSFFG